MLSCGSDGRPDILQAVFSGSKTSGTKRWTKVLNSPNFQWMPNPFGLGHRQRSALKMMTPREPIEVVRLIASGRWKSRHITSYREQFGDDVLYVLLCAFVDDCSTESLTHYDCQQTTGRLLLEIMPENDRPLRPTIRKSLALWNPSVEEWPFFLNPNIANVQ